MSLKQFAESLDQTKAPLICNTKRPWYGRFVPVNGLMYPISHAASAINFYELWVEEFALVVAEVEGVRFVIYLHENYNKSTFESIDRFASDWVTWYKEKQESEL